MTVRHGATGRIAQRLRAYLDSGAWTKVFLGGLTLLALGMLWKGCSASRTAYADDRSALLDLRRTWRQTAPGYGLVVRPARAASLDDAFQRFRARPSVEDLLRQDPQFAAASTQANEAFTRLETLELRGDPHITQYAAQFDAALQHMDARIDSFAKDETDDYRDILLLTGGVLLAAVAVFAALEFHLRASNAGAARNRAFSRALIAAQEGERLRLSYELHDAVAQDLAAVKLYCGLCEGPYAQQATRLVSRAIEEVRGICQGLRPAELDRLGIVEAVTKLCNELKRETGIDVKLTVEGLGNLDLEQATEINLYRILQEALANVRRHAEAKHVRVVLFGFGDYLELTVDDDGRGPRGTEPGLGRTGMEERTKMIGGRFHFGYGPWGGASLRVTVPAQRKEAT